MPSCCRSSRRRALRGAHRAGRRRPGAHLEGPQGRVFGRRPAEPGLHRAGWRGAARPSGRGAGRHRAIEHGVRTARRQCLSCRRRQSAPADSLQRPRRQANWNGPRHWPARSWPCASNLAAPSPANMASAWRSAPTCRPSFQRTDLEVMAELRRALDPAELANRGKMFPDADAPALTAHGPHPLEIQGVISRE